MNKQNILILCKVVDNFGDIGIVYRLAKALCDLRPDLHLTLAVSNLESFSAMAKSVDKSKKIQNFDYKNKNGEISVWKIVDWNLDSSKNDEKYEAEKIARENQIILECFQCGRPEWLENILFDGGFNQNVQIINIDYLTAEEYADDFHLLRSGTRKTCIKKIFFMPGFTKKTGGLIFSEEKKLTNVKLSEKLNNSDFKISFFAYERDCTPIVNAISEFQAKMREKNFSVCVFAAAGKSFSPFMNAYKKGKPFKIVELPFLQQEEWDFLLTQMNFNFVRGEDSLSRAALSEIPYIWNAYIQDDDYQLVKVDALLERMKPFFHDNDFELLKKCWENYNQKKLTSAEILKKQESLLKKLLSQAANSETFQNSFSAYSKNLTSNGNLAEHLLKYIETINF